MAYNKSDLVSKIAQKSNLTKAQPKLPSTLSRTCSSRQ